MPGPLPAESLSDIESARLRHKENVIERSAGEVAEALAVIRDERLYRATHSTFEGYCRERWGMSRDRADRHIVAAEVAQILTPMGVEIPERQARELADLRDDPDTLREGRASDRHAGVKHRCKSCLHLDPRPTAPGTP